MERDCLWKQFNPVVQKLAGSREYDLEGTEEEREREREMLSEDWLPTTLRERRKDGAGSSIHSAAPRTDHRLPPGESAVKSVQPGAVGTTVTALWSGGEDGGGDGGVMVKGPGE